MYRLRIKATTSHLTEEDWSCYVNKRHRVNAFKVNHLILYTYCPVPGKLSRLKHMTFAAELLQITQVFVNRDTQQQTSHAFNTIEKHENRMREGA